MESELARDTVEQLMAAGINFVTYLPETRLTQILPLLEQQSLSVNSRSERSGSDNHCIGRIARRQTARLLYGRNRAVRLFL